MTKIVYPSSSPYADTPQTSWYTGPIKWRTINYDPTDGFIQSLDAKYEYKPDLLSYDLYKTPAYWWVFMARNLDVVRDPIWDMATGIQLYVPTLARLQSIIGS